MVWKITHVEENFMVITGKKRWFVLIMVSLLAGVMVYVPFLRYSYYDQMVMLFSEYKPVASAANVNEFIGAADNWGSHNGRLFFLVWDSSKWHVHNYHSYSVWCRHQLFHLECIS